MSPHCGDPVAELLAELDCAADDSEFVDRFWAVLRDGDLDERTRETFLRECYRTGRVERIQRARDRYVEGLTEAIRADHERRLEEVLREIDARLRDPSDD